MASSIIKFLPCCKDLRIAADDLDAFRWWLQKVPEQLDSLQLLTHEQERNTLTLPGDFVGLPQIMTVPSLYFWCRAAFSDEQFLELKAKSMSFNAVNITDNGINQFLKVFQDSFVKVILIFRIGSMEKEFLDSVELCYGVGGKQINLY